MRGGPPPPDVAHNTRRAREALAARLETPGCYPPTVFIEPTNACNLRCPLCPTGSGRMTRPRGFVSPETCDRVFSEVTGHVEEVALNFYGEPMLHPELESLVRLGKRRGVRLKLYSNLALEPSCGWEALVAAGPDHLVVSIDGVTQDGYAAYRRGGRLQTVLDHLETLLAARERLGSGRPCVEVQMLALRANEGEWPLLAGRAEELGVDLIKHKLVNLGVDPDPASAELLPADPRHHYYDPERPPQVRPALAERAARSTCKELYLGPAIVGWDARFILCCRDHDATVELGSLEDRPIWDLWNGAELAGLRRRLGDPRSRPGLCRGCPALFLEEYVIERRDPRRRSESWTRPPHTAASEGWPSGPASGSLEQPVAATPAGDLPEPPAGRTVPLPDVPRRPVEPRTLRPGDVVDYGAYRTFAV